MRGWLYRWVYRWVYKQVYKQVSKQVYKQVPFSRREPQIFMGNGNVKRGAARRKLRCFFIWGAGASLYIYKTPVLVEPAFQNIYLC